MDWDSAFASRARHMQSSEIREFLKILQDTDVVSFAGGIPDATLFPLDDIRDVVAEAMRNDDDARMALQYAATEGYGPLRQWIAEYMTRAGVPCDEDNVLVTTGSQQALELLAKMFLGPGDTALVQEPTFLGALQAFGAYQPRYQTFRNDLVPSAEDVRTDALRHGSTLRFAYGVSDFCNPSGESLSLELRHRLLDQLSELGVPLIEDNPYQELWFDRSPDRSCAALAISRCGSIEKSPVVFCGSFSKVLVPGLRVGWMCGARGVIRQAAMAKQAADLHTPVLNQMIVHRLAVRTLERHLPLLREAYARKRDIMLDALAAAMPHGVRWTRPAGGLFTMLTMPLGLDATDLLRRSLREARVAFVPGRAFFAHRDHGNTARLNFSHPNRSDIQDGIARLGALVSEVVASMRTSAA
jgi:DNA-binding transcriptional MocR family regulator